MRSLLIFLALPLLALDNSMRLFDLSGSTQTNVPRTIHRYFAQGEFPSGTYPKPRVTGGVPATWQVDVENTWPDGSVMAAFISMPASITANSYAVVDFVRDSNPCYTGNLGACQAAALDQAAMLAFNGGAWDATLSGTANSITYSANARTILTSGAWSYRLRGPVVTQIVIEDVSRPNPAFDFGWEYTGGNWAAPSGNQFKSVHPLFTVSFYAGWAGVEIEALAQNPWTTRGQRQVFDLAVTKSGAASVYSKSAFDLPWGSQFSRYFWDGSAPPAVQIDWNLKYMIYSKILPPFEYGQSAATSGVNTVTSQYDTKLGSDDPQSCSDGGYCGNITKLQGTTGPRADIGIIPQWSANYLFVMGDTTNYNLAARSAVWNKHVIGDADAALTMPIMFRESGNGSERDAPADGQRYYFNYEVEQTTPAWGKIYSIQSRPVGQLIGGNSPDNIAAICSSGPCATSGTSQNKGWGISINHMPAAFYIPYVLTGRYSYLQGMLGLGAYMIGVLEPNLYYGNRNKEHGIAAVYSDLRLAAWTLREMHYAAIVAPDAAPEKAYFANLLRHNSAFYAGVSDDGTTHSCSVATYSSATATFTGSSDSIGACGAQFNRPNGLVRNFPVCQIITSVTSVTVNGVSKTVGVKGTDSGRDWYYTPGSQSLYQADGAPALTSGDTLVISYNYGARPASDWCHGRNMHGRGMPNPLAIPYISVGSGTGGFMGLSSNTVGCTAVNMLHYLMIVFRLLEQTGAVLEADSTPLFHAANDRFKTLVLEPALNPAANMYFQDYYNLSTFMKTGTTPQTWDEYKEGYYIHLTLAADVTNSSTAFTIASRLTNEPAGVYNPLILFPALLKIDNEWVLFCSGTDGATSTLNVCSGGRGMFGTAAAAHTTASTFTYDRQLWHYTASADNYTVMYLDSVALFEDATTAYGTGRRAWERVFGSLTGSEGRNTAVNWMIAPRDRIQNVRATPGTGTLALAWTAPSGAACTVAMNPASSDDSGDSAATAHGRAQSYNATGLTAGANTYRITCGAARVSGTVTVN